MEHSLSDALLAPVLTEVGISCPRTIPIYFPTRSSSLPCSRLTEENETWLVVQLLKRQKIGVIELPV